MDCINDDEIYLQGQTSFYDKCTIISLNGEILPNASENQCIGSRRCDNGQTAPSDDSNFIGFDPFGNCTCPSVTNANTDSIKHKHNRSMRQTHEIYRTAGERNCRILRTRRNQRRKACDETLLIRKSRYSGALQTAVNANGKTSQECEDIKEDPASCSILGFDCDNPGNLMDCFLT